MSDSRVKVETHAHFSEDDMKRGYSWTVKLTVPMPNLVESDVPSGCIGVCSTLFDDVCKGCGRRREDVDNWVFMTNEEKQAAVDRAEKEGTAMRFKK